MMPSPNTGTALQAARSDHLIGCIIALSKRMPALNGRTWQVFHSCQANSELAAGRSCIVVYAVLWRDLLIGPVKGIVGIQSALRQASITAANWRRATTTTVPA